jgi:hypothetical protein
MAPGGRSSHQASLRVSPEGCRFWYLQQGCSIPSNCLVDGNPPQPYELTNGNPPAKIKERIRSESDFAHAIRCWERLYRQRVKKWPVFLATEAEFLELTDPPRLRGAAIREVFGRVPRTLNPPAVPCDRLELLIQLATGTTRPQRVKGEFPSYAPALGAGDCCPLLGSDSS